jgi:hypothetical protein
MVIGLWALAAGLSAAPIVVSLQSALLLQSGDSLTFLFSDSSYARQASTMGIATSPSQIFFNLISAPVDSAGQFTAEVESADGSVSALFSGPLGWVSSVVQMSGYDGQASVLMGNLMLSSTLSQELFAESQAELTLTYAGPDVTVGLPGYSLENDLTISLASVSLSVGAMNYGVTLSSGQGVIVPEPNGVAMLFATGVLLCAVSGALKRFGGPRAPRDSESSKDRQLIAMAESTGGRSRAM